VVFQTGETDDRRDVRAWYVATDTAYQLDGKWKPKIGVRADIASGDTNASDDKAQGYDPLWPRGLSFVNDLGYANITAVGPTFAIRPTAKLSLDTSLIGLWRTTTKDGVYALSGASLRSASEGQSRQVGTRVTLRGEYKVNPFVTTGFYVNRTFAGDFLKETNASKDLLYMNLYTTFRF